MWQLQINGNIKITNTEPKHLEETLRKLKQCGCDITIDKSDIYLKAPERLKAINIYTAPYPGFPTDMQAIFVSTLIKAEGNSYITENIFENRYKYVKELIKLGANIKQDGKTLTITGEKKIKATNLKAMDLRGGAALIIAALQAEGISEISDIEYVLRGYENIDEKLRKLGAEINIREGE